MLYFSYGSNMSTLRLADRVQLVRVVTVARLYKHKLKFHKKGKDSSGKCDAVYTNNEGDIVHGVVFEMAASEKLKLDGREGLNNGYEERTVSIYTKGGEELEAVMYYATHIEPSLKPYGWYKEHVLRGAREHGLPAEYIDAIEKIKAILDPDQRRHEKELSIYR